MSVEMAKAHIEAQARIRAMVKIAIRNIWRDLGSYNEADVQPFLDRALPLVRAAQLQSVSATEAFLTARLGVFPTGVPDVEELVGAGARKGTQPEEVYRRPFVEVWSALSDGVPWEDAVQRGMERAVSSAATDVQLAMRETAKAVGEREPGIFGFQRVADGSACDLCLIASTQRYHVEDLMPIHNNCGCGVEPLTEPTGQIINRDRYDDLKQGGTIDRMTESQRAGRYEERAAANRDKAAEILRRAEAEPDPVRTEQLIERADRWSQRASDQEAAANAARDASRASKDAAVSVKEHGELGPVLTDPNHDFSLGA